MDALPGLRRKSAAWALVSGVLGPAGATALALALPHRSASSAATVYILGVVASAALGGIWGGLAAAVLSFVGLNYYFTQPLHSFAVHRPDEFVALAVFVAVAVVVGALVARVVTERDRAERTTAEATNLAAFTGRLLSDEPLEQTLQVAATSIAALFNLSACRIEAEVDGRPVRGASTARGNASAAPDAQLQIPLTAASTELGSLEVERPADAEPIGESERQAIGAFAGQLAMALLRANSDAAMQRARVEVETSDMRAALFSSVTHDLKTPLASITAGVSSLLDREVAYDDEQREELLRTSLEEANRLNRMVGNLLDLARMRAGALQPTVEAMSIEDIVASVLRRLQPLLGPGRVRTQIRSDLPDVLIDPIQIDQALTNILENAARFSPPTSEIRISAHVWQSHLELRVTDEGPGIPPEERERVFEPFTKADRGRGRGGTGLGLAIARAIAHAHRGRIRIEGTPTRGTAVVLELPLAPASATTPPSAVEEVRST
jgi:two-component system sensor histidine kinase KdpD